METLDTIVSGLDNAQEIKRIQAVVNLVKYDDIRVIPYLQRMAEQDESAQIRYLARKGLKVIKDKALQHDASMPDTLSDATTTQSTGYNVRSQVKTLVSSRMTEERSKGFNLAARLGDPELYPALQAAYLKEEDPVLKSGMLHSLAIVGGERAHTVIQNALKDDEHRLRANAVETAAMIGDDTLLQFIVPLLKDGDHRVAANAALALKEYNIITVLKRLGEMLESPSVNRRDAAAFALGKLNSEMALNLLLKASQDDKKSVRMKAVKGLEALAGNGNEQAHLALEKIFTEDEEGLTDYFSLLSEEQTFKDINHEDFNVRLEAVKNMVQSKEPDVLPLLITTLKKESDSYVKAAIIRGLGDLGTENDVHAIIPFLSDRDDRVRANAVETIGWLDRKENLGRLIPFLEDRNNRVRANAAVALGEAYPKKVIEALKEMASVPDIRMRISAAYACLEIASEEVIDVLGELARDDDLRVSEKAISSLGMLKDRGNKAAETIINSLVAQGDDLSVHDSFIAYDDGSIIQLAPSGGLAQTQKSVLSSLRSTCDISPDVSLHDTAHLTGLTGKKLAGKPHLHGSDEKYLIAGEIARGGMGIILNALDTDIRREVAMKVITGGIASSTAAVERFIEEVQVQGQLEHPHICPVHELGTDSGGKVYFTMKMVKGSSLAETIKEEQEKHLEPIDARRITELLGMFMKICDGIDYAHSKGVIHRDLKPGNIMVGDFGEVYVMDWGLAKIVDRDDTHKNSLVITDRQENEDTMKTMSGSIVGTPAYMPPEQARGLVDEMDERSDIYSLGALLYELLILEPPYIGSNLWEILAQVCKESPELPSERNPWRGIPSELDSIVMKCMAPDKEDRYRTVHELKEEIELFLSGRPIGAMEYSLWQVFTKWVARNRVLAAAIAAVVLVIVISFSVSHVQIRRQKNIAEEQRDEAKEAKEAAETAQIETEKQRKIAVKNENEARLKLVDALVQRGMFMEENLELTKASEIYRDVKEIITKNELDCYPYIDLMLWKVEHGFEGFYQPFQTFKDHSKTVTRVDFGPDGKTLISSGKDGKIITWNLESATASTTFPPSDSEVTVKGGFNCVDVSANGRLVAFKSSDTTVHVWDRESGEIRQICESNKKFSINCLAIRPDGTYLATGHTRRRLMIWDVATGERLFKSQSHTVDISCLAFTPDGQYLFSGDIRKVIMRWDLLDFKRVDHFWDHKDDIFSMAFNSDGQWMASGSLDTDILLREWQVPDWKEGKYAFAGHGDAVNSVVFHPTKNQVLSGSADGTIRVWDTFNRTPVSVIRGHLGGILSLDVSPDGKTLATGSDDTTVMLWRTSEENRVITVPSGLQEPRTVAFSPDGKHVAYGAHQWVVNTPVFLIDTTTGAKSEKYMEHYQGTFSAAFSPDGRLLAGGSKDGGKVDLWDVRERKEIRSYSPEKSNTFICAVLFSPDGKYLVAGDDDDMIRFWDLKTLECVHTIRECGHDVISLAYTSEGTELVAGLGNGVINYYDAETKELLRSVQSPENNLETWALSSHGQVAVSSKKENQIKLWSVKDGKILAYLKGHQGEVTALAITPDGKLLASGSMDNTIRFWSMNDILTGIGYANEPDERIPVFSPLITFPGHHGRIKALTFSRDGTMLASGSFDLTVKIWKFGDAIKPRKF